MSRPARTFMPLPAAPQKDAVKMLAERAAAPGAAKGRVKGGARPDLAVCFFGITRSLRYTLPSITANVLEPLRRLGTVRVYAHFFEQAEIDNPRSGERGQLDPTEYQLLPIDRLVLERPDTCLETGWFDTVAAYGDFWQDGNRSLRNLMHQLHSLDAVTSMALADGMEIAVFCRPDLRYHDSLAPAVKRAIATPDALVQLPSWQSWFAMNDRFAVAAGAPAIAAYGQRGRLAVELCRTRNEPLHAESLVKYAMIQGGIRVRQIPARATRVRFDGTEVEEDFRHPRAIRIQERFGIDVDPLLRWLRR